MKIAVTSQNRKTITGHAGKCRKFWIYEIVDKKVVDNTLLELALEQLDPDSLSPREALDALYQLKRLSAV